MKKVVFTLLVLAGLGSSAFAQNVKPRVYDYNYSDHGDRHQARLIANTYGSMLTLSRGQIKKIYYYLVDIYKHPVQWHDEYEHRSDKQLVEGYTAHDVLKTRMKEILTESQYTAYNEIKNYPENFFERGHEGNR